MVEPDKTKLTLVEPYHTALNELLVRVGPKGLSKRQRAQLLSAELGVNASAFKDALAISPLGGIFLHAWNGMVDGKVEFSCAALRELANKIVLPEYHDKNGVQLGVGSVLLFAEDDETKTIDVITEVDGRLVACVTLQLVGSPPVWTAEQDAMPISRYACVLNEDCSLRLTDVVVVSDVCCDDISAEWAEARWPARAACEGG